MTKKKKAPFPIYTVTEFPNPATCSNGEKDCDPSENPSHHISIDLTPEARKIIESLAECLEVSHFGDVFAEDIGRGIPPRSFVRASQSHKRRVPRCYYCKTIRSARTLLDFANEGDR